MKRHHDRRRSEKLCINNAAHGAAFKAGRCEPCYGDVLEANKLRRREQRAAAREAKLAAKLAAESTATTTTEGTPPPPTTEGVSP